MDPLVGAALVNGIFNLAGGLFGGGGGEQTTTQEMQPNDILSMSRIGGARAGENELVALQQALFGKGAGELLGGTPEELNLSSIASGRISPTTSRNLDRIAFSGLDEGLRRASAIAQERAGARGIGMSSIEAVQEAELQRPLISQAAGLRANLERAELDRLSGLRQNLLGNLFRMQESPALNRLLQLRMAEQNNLQLTRFPGGLPDFVRDMFGGDGMNTASQRKEQLRNEMRGLVDQMNGSNSFKGKQRLIKEMQRIKELWEKEFPDEKLEL